MAEINTWYVQDKDIIYDYDKSEYFFHMPGRGRQWTCCNLDSPLDIIYDQIYRTLYFSFGYNVIYSEHFYREEVTKKYCNNNKKYTMGFFK